MKKTIHFLKPILTAVLFIGLLKITGLLGSVSYYAQSTMIIAGFRDARPEELRKPDPFDFNFIVRDQSGRRINFSEYKGKVIFLNLWATWCGPCRAEMPTIEQLYRQVKNDSIAFVMLSVDAMEHEARVSRYIQGSEYTFPVYRPSGYLTEQLNVPSIPTTFIISKEGKIVGKEIGATNFDTPRFRKFLQKLASE